MDLFPLVTISLILVTVSFRSYFIPIDVEIPPVCEIICSSFSVQLTSEV